MTKVKGQRPKAWESLRRRAIADSSLLSPFDIRASSFKMIHAFAVEANPVSARVARASPCHKADPLVFAKDLLSSCRDSGRGT